ncbi:MAG TPA: metalloregulator ArsR/SmtB family transcription factor [Candidatus Nanoarchaeia archaeon]|nr:metalloregulator ArsR/SmtB family transcription factor [Candidatus Nanoarchaeia archaeon]
MIKHSPNTNAAYKLFFGSLANINRLAIINALRQTKRNVSEICQATGFEQTMVSHNLKRLERCGMVFSEQKGKHRYYSVNRESITKIMALIDKHMEKYCIHVLRGER